MNRKDYDAALFQRDINVYDRDRAKSLLPGFVAATAVHHYRKATFQFMVFFRGDALGLPDHMEYRLDMELEDTVNLDDLVEIYRLMREMLMVGVKELKLR